MGNLKVVSKYQEQWSRVASFRSSIKSTTKVDMYRKRMNGDVRYFLIVCIYSQYHLQMFFVQSPSYTTVILDAHWNQRGKEGWLREKILPQTLWYSSMTLTMRFLLLIFTA